ncbi:hypothetical protein K438DRAFT_2104022 [Mycena galopus ATCC 62051]|nr:hypothetical protein K438DRAFT_2104022 [Mycena galopus ATCC 62051]
MTASFQPLTISIVGGGVGGLTAAVPLRRNGHHVQIFEAAEIKAKIVGNLTVQINALRVLDRFGVSRDNLKGVPWQGVYFHVFLSQLHVESYLLQTIVFSFNRGEGTAYPWLVPAAAENGLICRRIDLHEELKGLAIDEGEGPPAKLRLGTKVVACDIEEGTVTLDGGEVVHADCILGADGMHSGIRAHVVGRVAKLQDSGLSCFRFIVEAEKMRDIPELEWVYTGISGGRMVVKDKPFRLLFVLPSLGSLLSVTAFYADSKDDTGSCIVNISPAVFTPTVTQEEFIAKYHDFDPKFLRILDLPMRSPILRWKLRVTPPLPNWVRGRAALLGDAVHATVPLLGQGAGMAVEEAAALGCLLPAGTRREDIPAQLEAYQNLRKQRGDFVNLITAEEMQRYLLEYDAVKEAEECYRQVFGGGISGKA